MGLKIFSLNLQQSFFVGLLMNEVGVLLYLNLDESLLTYFKYIVSVYREWKRISHKQSIRWKRMSQLKASAFLPLQKISCYAMQQLILGIGNAI